MKYATVICIFIVLISSLLVFAEDRTIPKDDKKTGLWAATSVPEPLVTSSRLKQFQVHFAMLNEGERHIDPGVSAWRLQINGKDHPDSQLTFANGPRDERWKSLPAHQYLRFAYAIGDWFKKPGTYSIVWKGDDFESPPVVFRVLAQSE